MRSLLQQLVAAVVPLGMSTSSLPLTTLRSMRWIPISLTATRLFLTQTLNLRLESLTKTVRSHERSKLSVDKGEVTIKDHENEVFRVKVYVLVFLYFASTHALSFLGRRKSTLER